MIELMLYLYAESPLHPGGADSVDALDLPVQREVTTGYPVIWGQSLKGALRQAAGKDPLVTAVFGSGIDEDVQKPTSAGLLAVGDAQLVAMPVPTLQHTFAWATSALALNRLRRRYRVLAADQHLPGVPVVPTHAAAAAHPGWLAGQPAQHAFGPCLVTFPDTAPSQELAGWAGRIAAHALDGPDGPLGYFATKLGEDLVLFGDDVMTTLLAECTEFVARVQLNDGKTVQNGPFYSEYLPAETILVASLSLRESPDQEHHLALLRRLLHNQLIRIGGDETIGKGLAWTRLVEGQ
jgi:CRISPR-associated protein Cmr4